MLTEATLLDGVSHLCARDPDLHRIVEAHGHPPLRAREPGFATLIQIILEQQVSLASARAAYRNLEAEIGPPRPTELLTLDDARLRAIGFSRQKTRYARLLAEAVRSGELDLRAVAACDDEAARGALMTLPGIGPWTADIYLLMALGRPDVWPVGDIALTRSAQAVKRLRSLPGQQDLEALADGWRPWRSVAARLLWHRYLEAGR